VYRKENREIWKDVPGFRGIYQISNKGRLKSFKQLKEGKIMSLTNKNGDYLSVVLASKNKKRSVKIHQLVAEAFVPNYYHYPHVHHIDGNKQNNDALNLEWVSAKDHVRRTMAQNSECILGMVIYNSFTRPGEIQQCSLDGTPLKKFINAVEASRVTGVCDRNILQVANQTEYKPGKTRKQAGGYIWRFAECSQ
jgi:hypothetical protein